MSILSHLSRYRFLKLFLTTWLIVIFLFSHGSASSQNPVSSESENSQSLELVKNIRRLTVTENVKRTVLENGLTILTKEVHNAPVVTVQVWYKVGSRNEEPGINGISHQLEHLMFKGTKDRPVQFGKLFSALGSDSNAFTSYDQTAYYSTAEPEKLNSLLVLEADRMQNSLINAEHLASEKRVVISELQGYENSPEYRLNRAVMEAAFPDHPYGLPVGGTKADVERFTVEQVREYYEKFYNPEQAVLVIVGDFQTSETLEKVKEVFGKIQNQKSTIDQPKPKTPSLKSHTPIVLREPGAGLLLQIIYPVPDLKQPDIPALDVMDYILTVGRNSYLYQLLVESGLANEISTNVASLRDGGWYEMLVNAAPNQNLQKIDQLLMDAIANLTQIGVTPEQVEQAKTQLVANTILNSRDLTSQAMQLGNDEVTADDYTYTERYLDSVRQVKVADVMAVINKYLKPEARTVGFFEPTQKQTKDIGDKTATSQTRENFVPASPEPLSEVMKYLPPQALSSRKREITLPQSFTLVNGIKLLLLPDKSTPTVTLNGYIQAGTELEPMHQAGLASLVADSLMDGTKTKDSTTISENLERRGVNLDFEATQEGVNIEGSSLAEDLPILLETLADVVKESTFPNKELELSRQQALAAIDLDLDDTNKVAERTFIQSIYPKKHPLHRLPTEESIKGIKRQDVINFKAKYYRPDTTILTLVGDFEVEKVRSLIQNLLGDWQATGKAPTVEYPTVTLPATILHLNPILEGKNQAITYMGSTGIKRKDPRYYAALVLNQILGGDTLSSRLGSQVRDRQGLTYGIYSDFHAGKDVGTFVIEMQTSAQDAKLAIASTSKILQQIHQQGVTELEVETAKRTLISQYKVSLANPDHLAARILTNQVYGLDTSELHNFNQKIQQVTLSQVNQAARELLHPDKIVVVTAGPPIIANQNK
ncbi:pitrilysin family protein [Cronbergia sp. UHCC 0137]|uniref:M16 family metallopeptidase n=1 Tax=Cronbergia sp. UHCC 0137 TaxID=3110239 RepID=UPI002B21F09E|nr:pitrilysin family protein [Cronbergia sp. UHCC 0137]MEA5618925.1 pitrilysin family protein [Cronbergia sp. UHCC 0137]